MEPDRIDLTPLDATASPRRAERLVRAIMRAAQPELLRRAEPADVFDVLADWAKPLLAAAAVLAFASAVALSRLAPDAGEAGAAGGGASVAAATPGVVPAAGVVPASVASWIEEQRPPARGDLLIAMEEGP